MEDYFRRRFFVPIFASSKGQNPNDNAVFEILSYNLDSAFDKLLCCLRNLLYIFNINSYENYSNFIGDECSEHDIAGNCTSDWQDA